MKEYEIVATYCNGCAGSAKPETYFEEAELSDPGEFVRTKHGRDFDRFEKTVTEEDRIVYTYDNGTVRYVYEFTPI